MEHCKQQLDSQIPAEGTVSCQVQRVVGLNIEGVFLINSGEDGLAAESFNEALSILTKVSKHLYQDSRLDDKSIGNCLSYKCTTAHIPSLVDEQFYICNQAIIFDCPKQQTVTARDIGFFASVVAFNMALCYHLKSTTARNSCCKSDSHVFAALHLYHECSRFLGGFRYHTSDTILILAGALNNQVLIYHYLLEFERKRQTLELLTSVVSARFKTGYHNPTAESEERELIEDYFLNIYILERLCHNAPPA